MTTSNLTMRCHSCSHETEPAVSEDAGPTNHKAIGLYMHCGLCVNEGRGQNIELGWTKKGFQVWCRNHDVNILHVDFEGVKHKANTTRYVPEERPVILS
jgi:hypothetical protein